MEPCVKRRSRFRSRPSLKKTVRFTEVLRTVSLFQVDASTPSVSVNGVACSSRGYAIFVDVPDQNATSVETAIKAETPNQRPIGILDIDHGPVDPFDVVERVVSAGVGWDGNDGRGALPCHRQPLAVAPRIAVAIFDEEVFGISDRYAVDGIRGRKSHRRQFQRVEIRGNIERGDPAEVHLFPCVWLRRTHALIREDRSSIHQSKLTDAGTSGACVEQVRQAEIAPDRSSEKTVGRELERIDAPGG